MVSPHNISKQMEDAYRSSNNTDTGQYNLLTGELDPVQHSAPLPEIAKREKQERKYVYQPLSSYDSVGGSRRTVIKKDSPAGRGDFVWTGNKRLYHGGSFHIQGGIVQPTSFGTGERFDNLVAFASSYKDVAKSYRDGAKGGHLFSYLHEVEPLGPVEREDRGQNIVASPHGFKVVGSHMILHDGTFVPNKTIKRSKEPRLKPEGSLPDFDEVTIGKRIVNTSAAHREFRKLTERFDYRKPSKQEKAQVLEYHNKLNPDDMHTAETLHKAIQNGDYDYYAPDSYYS